MVNISQRPPKAADRTVPGHWEGDLIIGKRNPTAVGILWSAPPATRCRCTCPRATSPSKSPMPWPRRSARGRQRASDENTDGLLRQYFPKGTDLGVHDEADLDRVAAELGDRPRKRLGSAKPIEQIGDLLLAP